MYFDLNIFGRFKCVKFKATIESGRVVRFVLLLLRLKFLRELNFPIDSGRVDIFVCQRDSLYSDFKFPMESGRVVSSVYSMRNSRSDIKLSIEFGKDWRVESPIASLTIELSELEFDEKEAEKVFPL